MCFVQKISKTEKRCFYSIDNYNEKEDLTDIKHSFYAIVNSKANTFMENHSKVVTVK